jgi:PAS domain S-box-containing protein
MTSKSVLISTKLRLLVLVGVVTILLVGGMGIFQLSKVDYAAREIRSKWMLSIQFLADANAALANHRMKTYKHITLTDISKMNLEEEEMNELFQEARKDLDNYRGIGLFTDFEKEAFGKIEKHLENYASVNAAVLNLSRQNLYDSARAIIYTKSFEQYTVVNKTIKELQNYSIEQSKKTVAKSEAIFKSAIAIAIVLLVTGSLVMMGIGQWILKGITHQLSYLKSVFEKLSLGDVNVRLQANSSDEIGQLSKNISSMITNLQSASEFSRKIGAGNLNSQLQVLSDQDILGISLNDMQKQLKMVSEEDRKRNWAIEGLAKLGDILRAQHESSQSMYDQLIKFVVKYTESLQGGLFLVNDAYDGTIDLVACYAYERKKFIQKKVQVGEGMVGQVYLEKMTCYLLDIPQNYLTISSGLGGANPTALLIVPMKIDQKVVGIIEIASFNPFEKYRIEFVEKLADSIAATVASVRVNEKTKVLLNISQQQTEELRAQEEEVRQNLEEMNATQEELNRKSLEYQDRFDAISDSCIGTVEFDPIGKLINANQAFLKMLGYDSFDEVADKNHSVFIDRKYANSTKHIDLWNDILNGLANSGHSVYLRKNGTPMIIHCNYKLIKDRHGAPLRVMIVAVDPIQFVERVNGKL